jgi:hypothetical protein
MACCVPDSIFSVNDALYNLSSIRCDKPPQSTVKDRGHRNATNTLKGSIGFNLENEFLEVIEVCYDILKQITVHTRHILNRNIISDEREEDRKNYILLELFETPDRLYTCKNQILNLGNLLHSQTHIQRYIDCDMYITKVHLVPKNDLLFEFQQKITSYDVNTVPIWQTINTGNWRILENRIRRYENIHNVDPTIVTGTLNVTSLPDLFGVHQKLYPNKDENSTLMPVFSVLEAYS